MLTTANSRGLLTVNEVAARLRLHPMTVRRMIGDGRLPAVQLGGPGTSIRVDPVELEHWLYEDPAAAASPPRRETVALPETPAERRRAPDLSPAVEARRAHAGHEGER